MAHGKSLLLKAFDEWALLRRQVKPLHPGASRDRSLRGKARIKARKAKNRRLAQGDWK